MKTITFFLALFFASVAVISAQNRCLTPEEAKKVVDTIKGSPSTAENKKLRKELFEMRDARQKLIDKIAADSNKNQNLIPESNQMGTKHLIRVCQILKENGWLTSDMLGGGDGLEAFIFLITNNREIQAQQELLPVLIEAAKKGYIGNPLIASLVDSIRVGSKLPQLFGTQAVIRNNVVYLQPLLNEEKVDEWRKEYDLPPLAYQIRAFEGRFQMPVLKAHRLPTPPKLQSQSKKIDEKNEEKPSDTQLLGISEADEESIKVETKLVNLNVRVLTQDLKVPAGLKLTKDDFTVSENGTEQEISFFSNTEQPFDLVLLLDFSGSTVDKRGLIKKAAQRFVELARPVDRVAVVAFASDITTISELTNDKTALNDKIREIDITGASPIWDSVKFVYNNILKEKPAGRRSAIVFMTDAEDNSLNTTFADVMEIVRGGDTTIFPIYLGATGSFGGLSNSYLRKSQQSLYMLAEESGGQFYKAKDAGDLKGIYEQVINELSQVYSIGYEPKNETRDGGWRALTVKIKTQPNLVTRTRSGYYAN